MFLSDVFKNSKTLVLSISIVSAISNTACAKTEAILEWQNNILINTLEENKSQISEIINLELEAFYKISNKEKTFFLKYFNLNNIIDIEKKIKEIQIEAWIKEDWIIWEKTLEAIYLLYYSNNKWSLDYEIEKRLKIYEEMSLYKDKNSRARLDRFSVFKNETFFWKWWENIEWTYITENLIGKIADKIDNEKNIIMFHNVWWKSVISLYLDWELHLTAYISPWTNKSLTPKIKTFWKRDASKYYVSRKYKWSIMPYAVHVDKWIFIHWSDSKINWYWHSHWCIRVWLYYIEEIFRIVNKYWIKNIEIDTNWIY